MFANTVTITLELMLKIGLESFFGNNFMIIETPKIKSDPLKFKDSKKYVDRLKKAKKILNLKILF